MGKELENNAPGRPGRPKGSLNARTSDLLDICKKHDFNPFEALVLYAKGDHETLKLPKYTVVSITKEGEPIEKLTISPELRQKSAKDACAFIIPTLKAVELTGAEGADIFARLIESINDGK